MIIRPDKCPSVQVQFALRTYSDDFFGVPCCKTPCGDGFILEVHHTRKTQFEQAFKKWFVAVFGKYLTKKENVDSIFEQLRRNDPYRIEMLKERTEHMMDMAIAEEVLDSGKDSDNLLVKAGLCYVGALLHVPCVVKEKGILSHRVTGPHSAMIKSLEIYHAIAKKQDAGKNIKKTFQNDVDNRVHVCYPKQVEECPVKGNDADYQIIIDSINKTEEYLSTDAPVYKRYMLILEEFHKVQRACQRIAGQQVINFEFFRDRHVDTDQETYNLGRALEYFRRSIKNVLDHPPFSSTAQVKILGVGIVPTCVEPNASTRSILYVFSRKKIGMLLSQIDACLAGMPMSVEREISTLQQSTSNGASRYEDSLEEKRRRLFHRTSVPRPGKERWYLLCVVLLLVVYAYSPKLSGLILGIFLWIAFRDTGEERKGSSHQDSSKSSMQQLNWRQQELYDQSDRKKRLQELREMIVTFLQLNPHCFCVALERPCRGIERYTISNIGDFENY